MFEQHDSPHCLTVRMDTNLLHVDTCIERIRIFLDRLERPDLLFAISLLAREALNNAMIHGNGKEATREVLFELQADVEEIRLKVVDQGTGFDWRSQLNRKSDISEESGRGHEIYRSYATNMTYNDKGNQITLHIALT